MLGSAPATDPEPARKFMILLGLSPTSHESAAGILVDGKIVAAASEERFSRVKNQGGFPFRALEFCFKKAGVDPRDVDHVAYAALPYKEERRRDLANFGQNLRYVASSGGSAKSRLFHLANYTKNLAIKKDWIGGKHDTMIRDSLRGFGLDQKLVFVDHHLGHCASAYYCSGFERALVVSLDGYGSGNAGSFYLGEGGKLRLLTPIPYPHSLGTFYRRVTQALGFKPNRHEGKIVGLAAFGDPSKLYDRVRARFDLEHEDYYRFTSAQDPFFEKELARHHTREDIAAAYQKVLEDVAVHYVKKWLTRTGATKIACAGGVFANVKMNQRIMEIPGVSEIFVFPAMSDCGVGIGAALALQSDLGKLEPARLPDVYLGPSYSDAEMEQALRASGLPFFRSANVVEDVVDRLVKNKVVARFGGAMEFGPRALGNRSHPLSRAGAGGEQVAERPAQAHRVHALRAHLPRGARLGPLREHRSLSVYGRVHDLHHGLHTPYAGGVPRGRARRRHRAPPARAPGVEPGGAPDPPPVRGADEDPDAHQHQLQHARGADRLLPGGRHPRLQGREPRGARARRFRGREHRERR